MNRACDLTSSGTACNFNSSGYLSGLCDLTSCRISIWLMWFDKLQYIYLAYVIWQAAGYLLGLCDLSSCRTSTRIIMIWPAPGYLSVSYDMSSSRIHIYLDPVIWPAPGYQPGYCNMAGSWISTVPGSSDVTCYRISSRNLWYGQIQDI